MPIKHHFSGLAGSTLGRLGSYMHAENPSENPIPPQANAENTLSIGNNVITRRANSISIGGNIDNDGLKTRCIGFDITNEAARESFIIGDNIRHVSVGAYVTYEEGDQLVTEQGQSISPVRGDDRNGFSTVVVDAEGNNPQTVPANQTPPNDSYAPAGGTTAKIVGDDGFFTILGDGHVVFYDAEYAGETGSLLQNQLLRPRSYYVAGGNNRSAAKSSAVVGFSNAAHGHELFVAGNRNTASGQGAFGVGTNNVLLGTSAGVFGHGCHTDGITGSLHYGIGYFSTPGDARDMRALLAARIVGAGWYRLEADSILVDRNNERAARLIGENRVRLRDESVHHVTVEIVARNEAGDQLIVANWNGSVKVVGGTASSTSLTLNVVEAIGDLEAEIQLNGLYFDVRVKRSDLVLSSSQDPSSSVTILASGGVVDGADDSVKAFARVNVVSVSFGPPAVEYPWPNRKKSNLWPAEYDDDATLQVDFARNLAGWRASTDPAAATTFGTVDEFFAAFGDAAGADVTDRGLGASEGAAPILTDLTAAGGPGANGALGILLSWLELPSTDETIVVFRDSDSQPRIKVWYDVSADPPVKAELTDDAGATTIVDLGTPIAARMIELTIAFDATDGSASLLFSDALTLTPSGSWTPTDLNEVQLLHGDGIGCTARIHRLVYAPDGTLNRLFGVNDSPRWQSLF